jgi:hypothetical protein
MNKIAKVRKQINAMFRAYGSKRDSWTPEKRRANREIIIKHMDILRELVDADIELDDLFNS